MSLSVSELLYQELRAHGEETYPNECCGIMLGKTGDEGIRVEALIRAGNTRLTRRIIAITLHHKNLSRRSVRDGRRGWILWGFITRIRTILLCGRLLTLRKRIGLVAVT